jgi:multidrug efflux system membrane fusion protein
VLSGQQGSSVFVVSDSGRAWLRKVTVARATDSLMILSAGVKEGERVVSAGQVRLTDGVPVKILGVGGDSAGAAR